MRPGALVAGPALLAGLALAWLAVDAGGWPWNQVVHEDGRRTLAETVFYPRHFLRELPVLAFDLAALALIVPRAARGRRGATLGWLPWAGAVGLVAGVWWTVAAAHGADTAWRDLTQFHIRDNEGWRGAHWGAHAIANLLFLATVLIVRPEWAAVRWTPVIALVLVGTLPLAGVEQPIASALSPRAAAHQVREWLTHAVVTLPLALAAMGARPAWRLPPQRQDRVTMAAAALVVMTVAVLAVITLAGGALEAAPARWSARLAAHLFEHTLDYVFVGLVAWGMRARRAADVTAAPPAGS